MVKLTAFKTVVAAVLLGTFICAPQVNVLSFSSNINDFRIAAAEVKSMRSESADIASQAKSVYNEYLSLRTAELDPTDPVAITKSFKGLEGVTVTSVNALSLTPTPTVIGTYDENSNQWCEGLEFILRTDTIEDTLLRIEKMQLSLVSLTVQEPKTIIVRVNVKGV